MDLQNIFLTIWNMSLTGSIIILFVLLARLMLRKAPKVFSYALWSVVLFRLLCPVSVSSVFSVLNFTKAAEPVSQSAVTTMDYSGVDIPVFIPFSENELEIEEPIIVVPEYQEPQLEDSYIPDNGMGFAETPDVEIPQAPAEPGHEPIYYAVIIWLVGLGVMLIYNVISCIRLFRQIEGAAPLRKELYLADYISTAFVLGIINPKIYLPSYLSQEERGYIIAHERCHIKRKDHVFRLLAYLALCLHWFNPLVWLAFVLSGKDMEMSCDEAVIRMYGPRIRAEYSQSLLRLATGHRSFALTPLAFGEGDTKERVINLSKWKKPKLWAIICALICCIGILVACATNPTASTEQEKGTDISLPTETAETSVWDGEVDAKEICIQAIEKLLNADHYCIQHEQELPGEVLTTLYKRHGDNYLVDVIGDDRYFGSRVYFEGSYGMYYGDYWVWEDYVRADGNDWLKTWSPDYAETSNWEVNNDTISYFATWPDVGIYSSTRHHEGTCIFTFNTDGTLKHVQREYVTMEGEELVSGVVVKITPCPTPAEVVYADIKAIADQCITQEQLEQYRLEKKTVSEIPSNKTTYDTNYELGAGQMRWYFFNEGWQTAIGAENITATSATIFHCESNDGHKALVAEDSFWLEKLVDGKWQYVDENKTSVSVQKQSVDVTWNTKGSYTIDWSSSYGALKPGFYRLGRYYTVTLNSGESETQPCYAKFRIMDGETEDLVKTCRTGIENLMNWNHHIKIYELIDNDVFIDFKTEQWKCGNMYLARTVKTRVDESIRVDGRMYREEKFYELQWSGDSASSPISGWQRLGYGSTRDFNLWSSMFNPFDDQIESAVKNGNSIVITLGDVFYGNDSENDFVVLTYEFDDDGMLTHVKRVYAPTLDCKMDEMVLEMELTVMDTPGIEIKDTVMGQDVSKPIPFTYTMDVDDYPDARKDGFVNVEPVSGINMETAILLADRECTMKVMDANTGERYNIIEVFYDDTAKMWKVVLRYSQNIDGDQAIYINDRGITQMVVTYTEENDPTNVG